MCLIQSISARKATHIKLSTRSGSSQCQLHFGTKMVSIRWSGCEWLPSECKNAHFQAFPLLAPSGVLSNKCCGCPARRWQRKDCYKLGFLCRLLLLSVLWMRKRKSYSSRSPSRWWLILVAKQPLQAMKERHRNIILTYGFQTSTTFRLFMLPNSKFPPFTGPAYTIAGRPEARPPKSISPGPGRMRYLCWACHISKNLGV